jgi:hypothetical protein
MIMAGGRTRSGARSHRSTPGPDGFQRLCSAGLTGQGVAILEPATGHSVAPIGHARLRALRVVLTCDHERP